jgi:hypothetical protein
VVFAVQVEEAGYTEVRTPTAQRALPSGDPGVKPTDGIIRARRTVARTKPQNDGRAVAVLGGDEVGYGSA